MKDADSISFFENNLPHYYTREGKEETIRRATWGYLRISKQRRNIVKSITYEDKKLVDLIKQVIQEAELDESFLQEKIDT